MPKAEQSAQNLRCSPRSLIRARRGGQETQETQAPQRCSPARAAHRPSLCCTGAPVTGQGGWSREKRHPHVSCSPGPFLMFPEGTRAICSSDILAVSSLYLRDLYLSACSQMRGPFRHTALFQCPGGRGFWKSRGQGTASITFRR